MLLDSWTVPNPEQPDATLTITAPANNGTVPTAGSNVTGTVSWNPTQVGTVRLYVDGLYGGSATLNPPNFSVGTGALTAGQHSLIVAAVDSQYPNLIGAVVRLTVTAQ